jgi:hypothetical protein
MTWGFILNSGSPEVAKTPGVSEAGTAEVASLGYPVAGVHDGLDPFSLQELILVLEPEVICEQRDL